MTVITVSRSDNSFKSFVRRTYNVCSTFVWSDVPSEISVVISVAMAIGWLLVLLFAAHYLSLCLAWVVLIWRACRADGVHLVILISVDNLDWFSLVFIYVVFLRKSLVYFPILCCH